MKHIRLGLIGLGGMAYAHMEKLAKIEGVQIAALCDIDPEALAKAAGRLGTPGDKQYRHYRDLIADAGVDAVLNITPNAVHAEIVECCLRQGMPVMTEKPFTRTYDEALKLYRLHEANPVLNMVGFSYRYIPSFRYARELIHSGQLGPIRSISVQYLQSWGVPMFGTPINWRYQKRITGTGALADLGSHMVDAARFLVGEFQAVAAQMNTFITERKQPDSDALGTVDVDDFAGFIAALEPGISGVFQTTRNAYGSGNQLELTIYGDLGTLHVNCERPSQLKWIRPQADSGQERIMATEWHQVPVRHEVGQLQDFIDHLRGDGREGMPTIADGFANQQVLSAVEQAAVAGKTVSLAFFDSLSGTAKGTNL
jgi:predicted dehydrogenase